MNKTIYILFAVLAALGVQHAHSHYSFFATFQSDVLIVLAILAACLIAGIFFFRRKAQGWLVQHRLGFN